MIVARLAAILGILLIVTTPLHDEARYYFGQLLCGTVLLFVAA
jgi:hypothetical protein